MDAIADILNNHGRKLATATNIVIVILISLSVARTVLFFVENIEDDSIRPEPVEVSEPATDDASNVDLAALNLFGTVRDDALDQGVVDAPDTQLNLELQGVFTAEDPDESTAIVAERNKTGVLFRIGDRLPGNAVLEAVYPDHILIKRGGRVEKLAFPDSSLRQQFGSRSSTSARRLPSPTPGPDVGPNDSSSRLQNIRERIAARRREAEERRTNAGSLSDGQSSIRDQVNRYKQRLRDDPQAVLNELGISPVSMDEAQGYRVLGNLPETAMKQAGLQQGDVILSVNGRPVGNVANDQTMIDQAMSAGRVRGRGAARRPPVFPDRANSLTAGVRFAMTGNSSTIRVFPATSLSPMHFVRRLLLVCLLSLPGTLLAAEDSRETWRINLKNADIREFITQVSSITGRSFIVDPRVKGNVTVISNSSMDAEDVYQLFLSVLRVHGYAAVDGGGDVERIVQQVLAKQSGNDLDFASGVEGEELVTRVLPVVNTDPNELVKILRPLIPQYGHIAGILKPNALIISDHASNIERLEEIVQRIDVSDTSTVRIVKLEEAWVEDMIAMLERLAPEQIGQGAKGPNRVTIVASERTNSMIVKGEPGTIDKIIDLVKELDVPSNRAGTIQVVRLAHSNAAELAEILKNLVTGQPGQGSQQQAGGGQEVPVSIQADEALNALVIRANPTTMMELKEIIANLDVRRLQVMIEAAIVEVTTNFTRELGSELAVADTGSSSLPLGLTAPSGTLSNILQSLALDQPPTDISLGSAPLIAGADINEDGVSFAAILRALSSNSDVNLLSTPSITTMDNQEAKIVVGQNVPFRTGSTPTGSQGTVNPFTTIQREDVGLTLEVTPHIHDGSVVRLQIFQEVSEVDQSSLQSIGAEGSADLITNKRTIETTVLADNEEVIILGGLIRDRTQDNNTRVPLLGSIPVLGHLFKSSSRNEEKLNLLVFLRPTVLANTKDVQEQIERKYSGIWEVEIIGKDKTKAEAVSDLFDGKR
ncbi:MAG: type II secretion system secretin GspD [Gammaproteobacteria bacterium]|nr:type II secretion system secretin GspD [Gammaproteobacteria bacterium]